MPPPDAIESTREEQEGAKPTSFTLDLNKEARDATQALGTSQANLPPSVARIEEQAYRADAARDHTRETVTMWLIGLFCAIVILTFVALYARGTATNFNRTFFEELKQVLDVLVGPVVALLSSAIGFYFGYQQGERAGTGKP